MLRFSVVPIVCSAYRLYMNHAHRTWACSSTRITHAHSRNQFATKPVGTISPIEAALVKKSKKASQAEKISTEPTQGCRDFPPEEMRLRSWLFSIWKDVSDQFGFEEYDAPLLESEELYIRKAGEEITQQMYNFVTKDGHRVALRPEMTPTLARLIIGKGKALSLPVKWFSMPQCWRHEAISRGRRREHYQWNLDVVGVKSIYAEAELIAAMCTAFKRMGLTSKDVGVKINSRKLLQVVLSKAGVPDHLFSPVCIVVDKMEKVSREELIEMLVQLSLTTNVVESILQILTVRCMDEMAAFLGPDDTAVHELQLLFKALEAYGLQEWIYFDASVVRGLAYYTGVVFEAVDRDGKFRAICGGGRYDNLMTTFGVKEPIPACGLGFGDCVIMELLQEKKLTPDLPRSLDDVVIPYDESMRAAAIQVMQKLRERGRRVDIIMDKKKVGQSFNYADTRGALRALLVAPDEWSHGMVQVKHLREGHGKTNNQATGERGVTIAIDDL